MSVRLHDKAMQADRPGKARVVFSLAIMLCLFTACAPYHSAHRTLYRNLSEYPPVHDAKESCAVYRSWAEAEWAQVKQVAPQKHGRAYRRGFLDGFVDAVYAGGNGEPPVIPPRPYWRIWFRNAAGDDEIATWTQGFRHGARTALDGGYRERAIIPTTLRLMSDASADLHEPIAPQSVYASPQATPMPATTPAEEVVPPGEVDEDEEVQEDATRPKIEPESE